MSARFFRFAGELEIEKYIQGECDYVDVLVTPTPSGTDVAYIVEIGDGDGELEAMIEAGQE